MDEKVFHVGGVELRVDNRNLGADSGPSVRVYGEADGDNVQLLRFGKNDQRHLDKASVPDSVAWTIEQLGQNLVEMIRTAGYNSVAERVDQTAVAQVLSEVESLMRS